MSSRDEAWQRRIERLLDRLEAAAARWAELEYQAGLDTGRRILLTADAAGSSFTGTKKRQTWAKRSIPPR